MLYIKYPDFSKIKGFLYLISMEINSSVSIEVYGKNNKYYPSQKGSFKWYYDLIERSRVGVNISARVSAPEFIELTVEDEDGNESTEKLNTSSFEVKIEYSSLEDNSIGIGLHLKEVEVNLNTKTLTYIFNTNNF